MKTVKSPRLSIVTRVIEYDRRPRLVLGVTAAFRLGEEKELVNDSEMWPQVAAALEGESGILDEGAPKVRGEVLVTGSCYPPGGVPSKTSFVRVRVGTVDKRLAVIGDREWKHGVPTDPRPFDKMPVDWAHAFGGEGFDRNPKGRGFVPVEGDAGRVHPLPNIEDPGLLVTSPRDKPEPAGFGGLEITLPQRKRKFGTYDAKWLETRAFGFAADMDPTLFNLALPNQWIEGYFHGDEAYLIEHMHPTHKRIEGALPPLAVRVFVTQALGAAPLAGGPPPEAAAGHDRGGLPVFFKEVPTRLDTVRFFPDLGLGVLIHRGILDVAEDDAEDVRELLLACEDRGAPRPSEHYQRALVARRDPEQAGMLSLSDRDIVPQVELGWPAPTLSAQIKGIPRPELIRNENLKRRHALEMQEGRERIVAAGLDPKDFKLDDQAPADVDYEDPDAVTEFLRVEKEQRKQHEEEHENHRKTSEAALRSTLAAQGLDYDAEVKKVQKENAGPPKYQARKTMEQLQSLLAIARKHQQPVEEMEQRVADPAYLQQLLEAEERLKQVYVFAAHRQVPVDPVPSEANDMFRAEIEVAHHNEIALEHIDFSGANLSDMNLAGMNLAGGFLEAVDFSRTDLSGANLERTVLAHAKLAGTKLVGARLSGANLGGTEIVDADLSGALLDKTILENARIVRSSLRGVKFDNTSMLETRFEDVDLGEATAELMVFYKLDLRGARLRGARFRKCVLVECDLRGADLSGVDLAATALVTCAADGANFCDATLAGTQFVVKTTLGKADFSRANLSNASLRGIDLTGVRFTAAVLDCADVSKCNLTGAELGGISAQKAMFIASNLTGANLAGADLLSALLTRAKLCGADLTRANLFQADMAKVEVDGATRLDRANLGRARVHPKYQAPPATKEDTSNGS